MSKLNGTPKNWIISAHVASGRIWLGPALCMMVIALTDRTLESGNELYAINAVLKLLEDSVIVPAATLSLLTGGLLFGPNIWGFTKFY